MSAISASRLLSSSFTPFLYPCLDLAWTTNRVSPVKARLLPYRPLNIRRCQHTASAAAPETPASSIDVNKYDHLTPQPPEYTTNPFVDSCTLTLRAGGGGHGCISFLREKYIANGPPDGGDGGPGGNVYIQAVDGETSLHKLARRPIMKAGKGKNGEGSMKAGKRGEDVLIQVPVGTVVREISRHDPLEEERETERKMRRGYGREKRESSGTQDQTRKYRRDKWLLYPGTLPKWFTTADFPALPRPRRSNLVAAEPPAPIRLDLDQPMPTPILLSAGSMGGLGNPHFVTKSIPRPKYATKGDDGVTIEVQLELKILADVGLVGLPNAGKSTLLRSLTRSRTRVGDWAFTTLAPTIGTMILDTHMGRANFVATKNGEAKPSLTIADIPGLIEDAHLDKGLGLGFLRHVERASVLAFVIDLSAGDAVATLKALWREVGEYEKLREQQLNLDSEQTVPEEDGLSTFQPFASSISPGFDPEPVERYKSSMDLGRQTERPPPPLSLPPISSQPWFVVATKADLNATQDSFDALQEYMRRVQDGEEMHPSGKPNAWRLSLYAVPVSALRKEGVERISSIVLDLLER